MAHLFVYGSLKEGFPNARFNTGRRLEGRWRTSQRLPLYLVGAGHLPCLVIEPGRGEQIVGQLYEVDDAALARMDALERVGEPGGYSRDTLTIERLDAAQAQTVQAYVYAQHPSRLSGDGPRIGPLSEYTLEQARHLAW